MSFTREADKLWRRLRRQGFTVERTNGGHVRITHPAMHQPVFTSATPSDARSLNNVVALLRRTLKESLT